MVRKDEVVKIKVGPKLKIMVEELSTGNLTASDIICTQKYTYKGYVNDCDMYVHIDEIAPLSVKSYTLTKTRKNEFAPLKPNGKSPISTVKLSYDTTRHKEDIKVKYQRCDDDCKKTNFGLGYRSYDSYEGDGQKSGLYIFRDAEAGKPSNAYSTIDKVQKFSGKVVTMLDVKGTTVDSQIVFSNFGDVSSASVVSRVKGIQGEKGQEVVARFTTDEIKSDKFYTDSNGMVMEERILNHREHYELTNLTGFEIVSNFYPVNSAITLKMEKTWRTPEAQFTILNDRAQSGSSLKSGQVEILIDRRTMFDDDRGVEEPLNETTTDGLPIIVETNHHVIVGESEHLVKENYSEVKKIQRSLFEEPLQTLFSYKSRKSTVPLISEGEETSFKYISTLPPSIKIVTKVVDTNKVMLRFYNMNEKFDSFEDPIEIDFSGIIADLSEAREKSGNEVAFKYTEWNLSLNQQIGKMKKIDWNLEDNTAIFTGVKYPKTDPEIIKLGNQEMRSFIFEFESKKLDIVKE